MNSLNKRANKSMIMKSNIQHTVMSSKYLDKLTNRSSKLSREKLWRNAVLTQMGADNGELWGKSSCNKGGEKVFRG